MNGFLGMLSDLNITKEQLNNITHSGKVIDIKSDNYYRGKSDIDGYGIFASKDILSGEIIGLGSIDNKYKTPLGRYTNHSDNNNSMFYYLRNNDVVMIAVEDINIGSEILINYRDHVLNKIYLNESV